MPNLFRENAGGGIRDERARGLEAKRFGARVAHDDGGGGPSLMRELFPAVTVPFA